MRTAPPKKAGQKDWLARLDWILLSLILFFVLIAIILVPTLLTATGLESVPFALHSVLSADYGVDPLGLKYFQLNSDIIAQMIYDQSGLWPGNGMGDIAFDPNAAMVTPEIPALILFQPSSTPEITDGTATPQSLNANPTSISGVNPTSTYPAATYNPPNATMVATNPGPSPILTVLPTATRTPGSTSTSPSGTVSPVTQPSPTASIAPTRTAAPTSQPPTSTSPLPTSTPVPPTRTPIPTEPQPTDTPRPTQPPDPYPPPSSQSTPYP